MTNKIAENWKVVLHGANGFRQDIETGLSEEQARKKSLSTSQQTKGQALNNYTHEKENIE